MIGCRRRILNVRFHSRMELVFHELNGSAFPEGVAGLKPSGTAVVPAFVKKRDHGQRYLYWNETAGALRRKQTSRERVLIPVAKDAGCRLTKY